MKKEKMNNTPGTTGHHSCPEQEPTNANAAETLWTQIGTEKLIRGYVSDDHGTTEYLFENTPQNIAHFIGATPLAERIVITDLLDREIASTFGWFIDRCPDQRLLREITSVLVPIQMGETEPEPILLATEEELERYLEQPRQGRGVMG